MEDLYIVGPNQMLEEAVKVATSLDFIDSISEKLMGELSSCKSQYDSIMCYNGTYLDDELEDFVDYYNNKIYSYKYLAEIYGGKELEDRISKIEDSVTELSKLKSEMIKQLGLVQESITNIEDTLVVVDDSFGDYSSHYGDGGTSGVGPSVAAAPVVKKAAAIKKKAEEAALAFDKNTKEASNSAFLNKTDTSGAENVNTSSGNNVNTSFGNVGTHTTDLSDSTNITGQNRSGGEYSVSGGYNSLGSALQDANSKLDDAVTSIDEIVKGKKYNIVPFSSISALGSDIVKGSAALPITSGLSAVGVSGLGLSALMKRKDEEDEDSDDSKAEYEIAKEEPSQEELNEYGKVKSVSDFEKELQTEEDKDTFSINDFIASGMK